MASKENVFKRLQTLEVQTAEALAHAADEHNKLTDSHNALINSVNQIGAQVERLTQAYIKLMNVDVDKSNGSDTGNTGVADTRNPLRKPGGLGDASGL